MSDWREDFENRIRIPSIGSTAWFECCESGPLRSEAERLTRGKHRVIVEQAPARASSPETFLVKFEGTDFVACGFSDRTVADEYAEDWNRQCA